MRLVDTNFDKRTSFLTLTTKENIQDRNQFNLLFDKFIKRLNYKIFNSNFRFSYMLKPFETYYNSSKSNSKGRWQI